MANVIDELEREQLKDNVPTFAPGDTVVVQVRVKEGERERLQAYEGVVIAKRNRGFYFRFSAAHLKIAAGDVDYDHAIVSPGLRAACWFWRHGGNGRF